MTNQRSNRSFFRLSALALVLVAAASASAGFRSSDKKPPPGPGDPDGLPPALLWERGLDLDIPIDKDGFDQEPLAYVDIPEIDRSPEDIGNAPAPSGSIEFPGLPGGDLLPVVPWIDPFIVPTGGPASEFDRFHIGGVRFDGIRKNVPPIVLVSPASSVPAPGSAVVFTLAAGFAARRRR